MLIGWEELTPIPGRAGARHLAACRTHPSAPGPSPAARPARRAGVGQLPETQRSKSRRHDEQRQIRPRDARRQPGREAEARSARPRRRRRGARPGAHGRVCARAASRRLRAERSRRHRSGSRPVRRRASPSPGPPRSSCSPPAPLRSRRRPHTEPSSCASRSRRLSCCSKARAGGSRTSPNTRATKAGTGVDGIRHRQADPLRIGHGSAATTRPGFASPGCSRQRCVSAESNSPGARAHSTPGSQTAHEMPHPHGQEWIKLPVLETTARGRHARRGLRQPGRPRQSPDDRVLVRRRLRARTAGRGPRSGRIRRTARLAESRRLADLARRDAGQGRQSRRPRRRGPRNAEGNSRPRRLHALAGPRRRAHHRPLPGGRRGDRHRFLPLVPAVGRGPQDRRCRGEGRSREGDGDRQALADPS